MNEELLKAGFIRIGNGKSMPIDALPPEAWEYLVGGPGKTPDLRKYFKAVAWLNRGVILRKTGVMSVPFNIKDKSGDIVDSSNDYQNTLGWLPNPRRLLGVIEQSLTMNGREYLFVSRKAMLGRAVSAGLRHMVANSIVPIYNKDTEEGVYGELLGFERRLGSGTFKLSLDEVVYFWPTDDNTENAPPENWPALAALQAAGVLYAVDGFATAFFERGAIKVTLLVTKGNIVQQERDKVKSWWNRLTGNAWSAEVVNADEIDVVPVGEGIDALQDTELTKEKREDISTALGVPMSMMWGNAANFATAQQDELNFYKTTIIPECKDIADVFNEQVFEPLGYRLEFEPQAMELFQEDEEHRAGAFSLYVGANLRPSIVGEMLGLELPEGVEYDALDEKFDLGIEMEDNLVNMQQPGKEPEEEEEDEEEVKSMTDIDLDKWHRKSSKRVAAGRSAACPFESEHIPAVIIGAIEGALEAATTAEDVDAVFSDVWMGYP